MDIFQQILELDDDDAHVYSRDLAGAYFAQARTTFDDMRRALYVLLTLLLLIYLVTYIFRYGVLVRKRI